ncbi:helix-turn-helix domain-containing protein [Jeotgalibacillus salarius]|uniref:RQC domain-containing protein n=1 Tax=Jeotgalibacillus salarius TaxID=546023 RepID=A0A4Y8LMB7_9BACL|nr:helix-turn-helix domain-containing protein [Jeotgalibacillus salarius]TFE03113.1 RQC domain-containing protein [Jeotgalibacillus salarius]
MNYFDSNALVGLDLINGERTQSSIYHLLKGKKTSQTIQDAQLFGISPLFQTYPSLSREIYDHKINHLEKSGLIKEIEQSKYIVTQKGKEQLIRFFSEKQFMFFLNGWKYHEITLLFWNRLTLMVQTTSNLIHQEFQFLPINRDVQSQNWVRHKIREYGKDLSNYASELHKELTNLLSDNYPDTPELIVQKLSGYGMIGLTNRQLAEKMNCEIDEIHMRFVNGLHFIFAIIEKNRDHYPLLFNMMELQVEKAIPYTKSTLETKKYLSKNFSIDRISAIRNLKRSTIEDHVLEVALLDKNFEIDPYVPKETAERINAVQSGSNRLKYIKDAVPEAEYFQIRLVLAKTERDGLAWKNYLQKNLGIVHSEQDKKKLYNQF